MPKFTLHSTFFSTGGFFGKVGDSKSFPKNKTALKYAGGSLSLCDAPHLLEGKIPEKSKMLGERQSIVYFMSSLRGQTAKTLICTKVGFPPIPERVPKSAREPHFLCIFCTLFVQKVRFSALFVHFLALFLESAETPLFVQINVFAVWPLRLDRKYTTKVSHKRVFVLLTPEIHSYEWLKCCKNQCSRSRAVSGWVWTPFCVILWRWLECVKNRFWGLPENFGAGEKVKSIAFGGS